MTSVEDKAKELVEKYIVDGLLNRYMGIESAKKCAKICVEEIINHSPKHPNNTDWDEAGGSHEYYYQAQLEEANLFWHDVLKQIDLL